MLHTVGHRLQQARVSKEISVEEAARATRIRPDKLIDLEEDNYANFPSMSYAKGFLQIYARYLGVDVRDYTDHLVTPNPVSTDDYEYLNAAASVPPPPPSRKPYHFAPRRSRSALPVVIFALLMVGIGFVVYFISIIQRLGTSDDSAEKKDGSAAGGSPAISAMITPAAATPMPIATPALRTPPPTLVEATPAPVRAAQPFFTPAATQQTAQQLAAPVVAASPAPAVPAVSPVPASTFDPSREVRRAEPVFPTPQAAASPLATPAADLAAIIPASTPEPMKELSIRPLRKTRVTIRRDVADSAPFFQDWLYPDAPPLKLSGHKFWIQVDDPTAVQITEDGREIPAGNNEIQIE